MAGPPWRHECAGEEGSNRVSKTRVGSGDCCQGGGKVLTIASFAHSYNFSQRLPNSNRHGAEARAEMAIIERRWPPKPARCKLRRDFPF